MRARRITLTAAIVVLGAVPVAAQTHHGTHGQPSHYGPTSAAAEPYAGLESRAVKALSEQQIADLRAGRGMGLGARGRAQWLPWAAARAGVR